MYIHFLKKPRITSAERERERAWHILILGLFSQLKTASQRFPRCGHFVPNRAGSICPQCFAVSVKAGDVLTNDQNSLCCEYESRDSPIMFKFLLIYFLDIFFISSTRHGLKTSCKCSHV